MSAKRARAEFNYYQEDDSATGALTLHGNCSLPPPPRLVEFVQRSGFLTSDISLSEEEREYLHHIPSCPKRHPWTMRLAYNSAHNTLRTFGWPRFVLGPVRLIHFRGNVAGVLRNVYLFADIHSKNIHNTNASEACPEFEAGNRSMHISLLLSEWFKRTDVFVDLFLEAHKSFVTSRTFKFKTCFLADTLSKFQPCIQANKQSCYYDAARVHGIDWVLRSYTRGPVHQEFSEGSISTAKFFSTLELDFEYFQSEALSDALHRVLQEGSVDFDAHKAAMAFDMTQRIHEMLHSDDAFDAFLAQWESRLEDEDRAEMIRHELRRLRKNWSQLDPDTARVIETSLFSFWSRHFLDAVHRYINILTPLAKAREQTQRWDVWIDEPAQQQALQILTAVWRATCGLYNTVFMDLYALARMFKRFKNTGEHDFGPPHATNIVVYAGEQHVFAYAHVLSSMGLNTVSHVHNLSACLSFDALQVARPFATSSFSRMLAAAAAESDEDSFGGGFFKKCNLSGGVRLALLKHHSRTNNT